MDESQRLVKTAFAGQGGLCVGGLALQDVPDIGITPKLLAETLHHPGFQGQRFRIGLGVGGGVKLGLLLRRQRFPIGDDGFLLGSVRGLPPPAGGGVPPPPPVRLAAWPRPGGRGRHG